MSHAENQPYCGIKPEDVTPVLSRRWPRKDLTIAANSSRLEAVAAVAAEKWSEASGLTIRVISPASFNAADLRLSFEHLDHGDGAPFRGPGGALAHGFYPSYMYDFSLEGAAHFDDSETWAYSIHDAGFYIFSIGVHEVGHTLGLPHSEDPMDIMYPYARGVSEPSAADIHAIQELYGLPPAEPEAGDPFHYVRKHRYSAWTSLDQWNFDALLDGDLEGYQWVEVNGILYPSLINKRPLPETI